MPNHTPIPKNGSGDRYLKPACAAVAGKWLIAWAAVTLVLWAEPTLAVEVDDGCDLGVGNEAVDIHTLAARFNADVDEVIVEITHCDEEGVSGDNRQYSVFFDHTAPFFDDEDRNGDGKVRKRDTCAPTWDSKMSRSVRFHRTKGRIEKDTELGAIIEDGATLEFRVPLGDLDPFLDLGDTLYIWARAEGTAIDLVPYADGGDGCDEPQVQTEVLALGAKKVFLSSINMDGDIVGTAQDDLGLTCTDGLSCADAICQELADVAQLGGEYMAWLSDTNLGPADRFTKADMPYVRVGDEVVIANDWADLIDCPDGVCLKATISTNENGDDDIGVPWTNTATDGTPGNSMGNPGVGSCGDWMSLSGYGAAGWSWFRAADWTFRDYSPSQACDKSYNLGHHKIYCFEQ